MMDGFPPLFSVIVPVVRVRKMWVSVAERRVFVRMAVAGFERC
jgi:hypothetical protein